ncbi:MAG: inositol monophosphatase [Oscillospiraceae bacterium]|nr:inositol monophosphatase [Oscillospiraceae bacterium]
MDHLQNICNAIEKAEREAAELILHAHGILAETKSGRRDVVTEYDRRVQALLMQRLGGAVPGAHYFCEELDERDRLDAEQLFIIDPIDGTMNFVHGFHHSCISVAYAERGEVLIGVIYNPYMDELFSAIKGGGAYLNGRPIHVTDEGLAGSVVCYGTAPYNPELTDETFETARKLYAASLDLRREGSAALDLCTVAAGRAGLYFELKVSLWDYAAGDLIVREAGGVCSRIDGSPFPTDGSRTGIAAGSPRAMAEFLALMKA